MVILPISYRYAFSKANRHRVVSFVIVFALAIGMTAIISILSVMNALQYSLLDELKTIESFHLEVSFTNMHESNEIIANLSSIDGVVGAYPFIDTKVIVQNNDSGNSFTSRMRGIPLSIFTETNPLSERISLIELANNQQGSVIMGSPLYRNLSLNSLSHITISYLGKGKTLSLTLKTLQESVTSVFYSQLKEFDASSFYIDLNKIVDEIGNDKIVYGLYLTHDSIRDVNSIIEQIRRIYPDAKTSSWQEIHAPFYSALLLEKLLMYLFLLCIFIIVAISIKNSTNRLIHAKERELAILRALGARKKDVSIIIIASSMIITFCGIVIGLVLGLLVSNNMQVLFSILNKIYYLFTGNMNMLFSYPLDATISWLEVTLISTFVFTVSFLFTYGGTRRLLKIEVMEMLNHE